MKLLEGGKHFRKHRAEFHRAVWVLCHKGGEARSSQLSREGALTARRRLISITHLEVVLGSSGPCMAEPGSCSSLMVLPAAGWMHCFSSHFLGDFVICCTASFRSCSCPISFGNPNISGVT